MGKIWKKEGGKKTVPVQCGGEGCCGRVGVAHPRGCVKVGFCSGKGRGRRAGSWEPPWETAAKACSDVQASPLGEEGCRLLSKGCVCRWESKRQLGHTLQSKAKLRLDAEVSVGRRKPRLWEADRQLQLGPKAKR